MIQEDEREHARCAPSDWEGWSTCAGKVAMEEGEPDTDSVDSTGGTLAHEDAAAILRAGPRGLGSAQLAPVVRKAPPEYHEAVDLYVQAIMERVHAYKQAGAKNVHLAVEQRLDISVITGERRAKGTSDCVIIAEFEEYSVLEVRDAKFGIGVVVDVVENGQLQIYALAALITHQLLHKFREVNLVIHQPRVKETPSEWTTTPEALFVFGQKVTEAAHKALSILDMGPIGAAEFLVPSEKACRFCKAKYKCPGLANLVHGTVFGEFQDIADVEAVPLDERDEGVEVAEQPALLSVFMQRIPLIETWVTAVRARVEQNLLGGVPVPGFKLVEGRRGARRWTDEDAVEKLLLGSGVGPDIIFAPKQLRSPAQLDKPLKGKPVLDAVQELTKQSEGKPSVAPADDPRPAFTLHTSAEFEKFNASDLV